MHERLKGLIAALGSAINDSISDSDQISQVITQMKCGGYDVFLAVNATITIKKIDADPGGLAIRTDHSFRFDAQDIEFLKSLHITAKECS